MHILLTGASGTVGRFVAPALATAVAAGDVVEGEMHQRIRRR